jgi:hypothetical protein
LHFRALDRAGRRYAAACDARAFREYSEFQIAIRPRCLRASVVNLRRDHRE